MTSQDPSDFNAAVDRRFGALSPRLKGYLTLAGIIAGMALLATYGPNDIWTSLLAGGVFGGIATGLLIRAFFMAREAWETRRLHLAVVVAGLLAMLGIWVMAT